MMQFFSFGHLPKDLQKISEPFALVADFVSTLPDCEERQFALRKLLEAKDCAVRAAISRPRPVEVPG